MKFIEKNLPITAKWKLLFYRSAFLKCFTLLLLAGILQSFNSVDYAQGTRISLRMNSSTVREILSAIEEKSEFYFTYNDSQVNLNRKTSIRVTSKNVNAILDMLFAGEDIKYEINDRHIVLYKASDEKPGADKDKQVDKVIKGVIKDSSGETIVGASVVEKGTNNGVSTDLKGNFTLTVSDNAALVITYLGYVAQEVPVGNNTFLTITLLEDQQSLNEVVVVGYGTQKKGNLTGAISTIKAKDIITTTNASLAQSLQGKVPGLQIRQQNGEPGAFSSTINIRGFGEPLYVIDGIVRDGGTEFQQLNPNDIENISILKDASAAIYGLNAANGVILVTTKKGIEGKPKFNYIGVIGSQNATNVPEMASASQYMEMYNDANIFRNGTPSITADELAKWRQGGPGYESTNWYDETFRKNAMQQQHDFSVRGGNENVNYFVSLGYFNENGLFKSDDMGYNRFNLRSNISAKLSKSLTADFMLSGRQSLREYPGGDGFIWIYKGTIISHPDESPFIDNNTDYPANIFNQQNAVTMSETDYAGYTQNKNRSFQSSASLTYKAPFLEGLQLKGTAAYDASNMFNKTVWKNYRVYSQDLTSQIVNPPRIGNAIDDVGRVVLQGQVNYDKTFADKHTVGATLVYEQKNYERKYSYLKREYEFFTNDIVDNASGLQTNDGSEQETANSSYVGRFNYNYKGKYMLEYAFRYDGSYRYTPGQRWGFFPVVSAGWRVSDENFFKNNISFISHLKFRASHGMIGEDVGDPFQHVLGFTPRTNEGYEWVNGQYTGGLAAPGVVNRNYTWVKSEISDIGFELSALNNKLTFEFDYYQRYKSGKIKVREGSLPNTFGGDMPVENLESERTKGFDFIVSHQNNDNPFKYGASVNFNMARTQHRNVDRPEARSSYNRWTNGFENRWNDFVWGYDNIGQFQNLEEIYNAAIQGGDQGNSRLLPGDYVYTDVNGDGIINNRDTQPIFRNRDPKLFYGFTLNGQFKNFDVNMAFQGAALYTIRFNEVFSQMFFNNGNLPAYFHDRWHLSDPYNQNSEWVAGKWPANRFVEYMASNYHESTAWRMNASYLRMKNLEIGYTLPTRISNKLALGGVRIYTNAHNLFTLADPFLKQFDPEKYEGDYQAGYNYPLTKSYNLGVNISF